MLPASKNDIGTHNTPKMIITLINLESKVLNLDFGCLNSLIPQNIVIGSAIIPTQVIKVPSGMFCSLLKDSNNNDEPDTSNATTAIVMIKKE